MKKINILFLFAVIISSALFTGCQKTPTMTASIDGASKNFLFRTTSKVGITDGLDGMIIVATTADEEYLALLVRGAEKGTYDLTVTLTSSAKFQCEAIYRPGGASDTTFYKGTSGSITISDIDKKHVSGSFDFQLKNSILDSDIINISSGQFTDLRYYSVALSDIAEAAFDL